MEIGDELRIDYEKRTVIRLLFTSIFPEIELLCLGGVFEYRGKLQNQQECGVKGYSG